MHFFQCLLFPMFGTVNKHDPRFNFHNCSCSYAFVFIGDTSICDYFAERCNALYSQCGGQSWTGSTCCINSLCTFVNAYYSQCLVSPTSTTKGSTTQQSTSTTKSPTTTAARKDLLLSKICLFGIML